MEFNGGKKINFKTRKWLLSLSYRFFCIMFISKHYCHTKKYKTTILHTVLSGCVEDTNYKCLVKKGAQENIQTQKTDCPVWRNLKLATEGFEHFTQYHDDNFPPKSDLYGAW